MVENTILQEISTILATTARVDPVLVVPENKFATDLDIDSVTMVSVVVAVEDHFGAVIPDEVWAQFVTVGDLTAYLGQIGVVRPL
ncbi:MAG TPA: acyl carrier protein [Mycobacterium sp.]|nr:acyl carrier protein [Mycobacterium sp.]